MSRNRYVPWLLFVLVLVGSGIYVLRVLLATGRFQASVALIGSIISLLALYWLWVDFIGPSLRSKD
jgi:hypothetical protein